MIQYTNNNLLFNPIIIILQS